MAILSFFGAIRENILCIYGKNKRCLIGAVRLLLCLLFIPPSSAERLYKLQMSSADILQIFCRHSADHLQKICRLSADLLQMFQQICCRLKTDLLVSYGWSFVMANNFVHACETRYFLDLAFKTL